MPERRDISDGGERSERLEKDEPPFGEITPKFLEQIEKYRLQFSCDECANFDAERGECLYNYPTVPHRRDFVNAKGQKGPKKFIFCREFELL